MNEREWEIFICILCAVSGYLIGCFVISLELLFVLELEIINIVGLVSFIPLGIVMGIVILVYFLRQFKVVRRE